MVQSFFVQSSDNNLQNVLLSVVWLLLHTNARFVKKMYRKIIPRRQSYYLINTYEPHKFIKPILNYFCSDLLDKKKIESKYKFIY